MAKFLAFGELLMRIAAPRENPGFEPKQLLSSFCGAEANIAAGLSGLGHSASFVSVAPDNPLGAAATKTLTAAGLDTRLNRLANGRMGLLFLEPGASARASRITYDREGSAFALCDTGDFAWKELLAGCDWLITSGITAALGNGPLTALQDATSTATSMGVKVAFDCNFRPTLWQGREGEAATVLRELSLSADLLLAGRRAIGMITGKEFIQGNDDRQFETAAHEMFALSRQIQHVAATRREVLSSDRHKMTALIADRAATAMSRTVAIENIVDRVGTGDAFAAGVLHGLCSRLSLQDTADFALACSQWAHSIEGDFLRATLDDIAHLQADRGDVRR